jgi:hypothetical protein
MKMGHVALMVCCLGLASVFLVNCGSSSPTSSNGATATPTPTGSVASYNLTGTVTWQGGGANHVYVLLSFQGSSKPASITAALTSGGTYSFTGLTVPAGLYAAYDFQNAGIILGGSNGVENGTGGALTNDVVCLVGYTGACPNTNGATGTYYSATASVPIVFGGTTNSYAAGQSGSNCTQ